jgi:hypothetical protein
MDVSSRSIVSMLFDASIWLCPKLMSILKFWDIFGTTKHLTFDAVDELRGWNQNVRCFEHGMLHQDISNRDANRREGRMDLDTPRLGIFIKTSLFSLKTQKKPSEKSLLETRANFSRAILSANSSRSFRSVSDS